MFHRAAVQYSLITAYKYNGIATVNTGCRYPCDNIVQGTWSDCSLIYTWTLQCIICLHAMTIILDLGQGQSVEDAPSNADVFSHWWDDVGCTVKHCSVAGSVSPIAEEELKWRHQGLTEQSLQYLAFPSCLNKEMRMKLWRFSVHADYKKKTTYTQMMICLKP